jgi:hypothetical protein
MLDVPQYPWNHMLATAHSLDEICCELTQARQQRMIDMRPTQRVIHLPILTLLAAGYRTTSTL